MTRGGDRRSSFSSVWNEAAGSTGDGGASVEGIDCWERDEETWLRGGRWATGEATVVAIVVSGGVEGIRS
ncbi:hypothetical protein NPX13_g3165 [Xylaria arbuscula]|uniref:Uncharacterized protein n=1 Tax=Xylaria arbuscula TaxID=114810 RepID=A0A9W8TPM1_9PEZI|nr:hypothetical protein NPX13_g3165 [Xylaria arbuscula]